MSSVSRGPTVTSQTNKMKKMTILSVCRCRFNPRRLSRNFLLSSGPKTSSKTKLKWLKSHFPKLIVLNKFPNLLKMSLSHTWNSKRTQKNTRRLRSSSDTSLMPKMSTLKVSSSCRQIPKSYCTVIAQITHTKLPVSPKS